MEVDENISWVCCSLFIITPLSFETIGKRKIKLNMTVKTKERIIRLIIYVVIGFAVAFIWHQMKSNN